MSGNWIWIIRYMCRNIFIIDIQKIPFKLIILHNFRKRRLLLFRPTFVSSGDLVVSFIIIFFRLLGLASISSTNFTPEKWKNEKIFNKLKTVWANNQILDWQVTDYVLCHNGFQFVYFLSSYIFEKKFLHQVWINF